MRSTRIAGAHECPYLGKLVVTNATDGRYPPSFPLADIPSCQIQRRMLGGEMTSETPGAGGAVEVQIMNCWTAARFGSSDTFNWAGGGVTAGQVR